MADENWLGLVEGLVILSHLEERRRQSGKCPGCQLWQSFTLEKVDAKATHENLIWTGSSVLPQKRETPEWKMKICAKKDDIPAD